MGKLVTGTFINRRHLAGYLEMIIPLALAFCLDKLEKKRLNRRENWRDKLQNRQVDSLFYDHVHNDYLEILVESGLVRMAIYFIMVICYGIVGTETEAMSAEKKAAMSAED